MLQNVDPDYSCGYVTVVTDTGLEGYGITFTAGRGTDIGALHTLPSTSSIQFLIQF